LEEEREAPREQRKALVMVEGSAQGWVVALAVM